MTIKMLRFCPVHRVTPGAKGTTSQMTARRFELVIFDCDGVLVDSEPIINRAHAHVPTACGYPITEGDLVGRFCGMSDAHARYHRA
jgi:hypothetical protein